jgi:hypothetical protein
MYKRIIDHTSCLGLRDSSCQDMHVGSHMLLQKKKPGTIVRDEGYATQNIFEHL